MSLISLGATIIPRRNWKQRLRKILGGKQGALWSMSGNGESLLGEHSLRTADAFPVVASLPPKIATLFFGGRKKTTGNASAVRRLGEHVPNKRTREMIAFFTIRIKIGNLIKLTP